MLVKKGKTRQWLDKAAVTILTPLTAGTSFQNENNAATAAATKSAVIDTAFGTDSEAATKAVNAEAVPAVRGHQQKEELISCSLNKQKWTSKATTPAATSTIEFAEDRKSATIICATTQEATPATTTIEVEATCAARTTHRFTASVTNGGAVSNQEVTEAATTTTEATTEVATAADNCTRSTTHELAVAEATGNSAVKASNVCKWEETKSANLVPGANKTVEKGYALLTELTDSKKEGRMGEEMELNFLLDQSSIEESCKAYKRKLPTVQVMTKCGTKKKTGDEKKTMETVTGEIRLETSGRRCKLNISEAVTAKDMYELLTLQRYLTGNVINYYRALLLIREQQKMNAKFLKSWISSTDFMTKLMRYKGTITDSKVIRDIEERVPGT